MNQKTIAIAAVLMAAALTATFATPLAYADESETSTDQEIKQKNVGSGDSNNNNCAKNQIEVDDNGGNECRNNNSPSD